MIRIARHLAVGGGILLGLVSVLGCALSVRSGPRANTPETLVLAKCSACHLTPERASLDGERFARILQKHTNLRRVRLAPDEQDTVRAYLVKPVK